MIKRSMRSFLAVCSIVLGTLAFAQTGEDCGAFAGTLNGFKPSDCLLDGGTAIGGIPNGDQVVPPGFETRYVLTTAPGAFIQQVRQVPIFDVYAEATYTVHTLIYDPSTLDLGVIIMGSTSAATVDGLLIQGGGSICASLDLVGTTILVENPSTGGLDASQDQACLNGGTATISAMATGGMDVPMGYDVLYVLTSGSGLVIQGTSASPSFEVDAVGSYTIHTLVYDPATLDLSGVQVGVTTGFDVDGLLFQGGGAICAVLDVTGAPVEVVECMDCTAFAGTITAYKPTDCLQDGGTAIGGIPNGNMVVPAGYEVIYVLTEGPDLTIQAVRDIPIFDVLAEGHYIVHTLVYDPATLDLSIVQFGTTTAADVLALLMQGGGDICASLDAVGAPVQVENPDAGGLITTDAPVCLIGGSAMISATPDGTMHVPGSYLVLYVLTQGPDLVIMGTNSAPEFTVSNVGTYRIHTLIYDPATLDLSGVVVGTTTGFDVNALLLQGGGGICAALDVVGGVIDVEICDMPCEADAGTLSPGSFETCLLNGVATVTAFVEDAATVPTGYALIYVLTSGPGLVIEQASATPEFEVALMGSYTIHSLVYDPNTLDLGVVVFGVTTGFDVNGLLIQGGGDICASLLVNGATTLVVECSEPCTADAGSLSGENAEACLIGGMATLTATANGDMMIPTGFSVLYVLTSGSGLVIQQVGADAEFEVTAIGTYTIHTLVYDPATLDLTGVVPGVTTGGDVNGLLLQGGGEICGSLDVAGAMFSVTSCNTECEVAAGTLTSMNEIGCLTDGAHTLMATMNGDAIVPSYAVQAFVLTYGPDVIIMQIGTSPNFTVTEPGVYSMHSFVYDPTTLDLSIIELGVTTAAEVIQYVVINGADVCASLDMTGVQFMVGNCLEPCLAKVHLTPNGSGGCLLNGVYIISGTNNSSTNIPPGYTVAYILVNNATQAVMAISPVASFPITAEGVYSIHGLVYDPLALDLTAIAPGITILNAVHLLLTQSDEPICAGIDIPGVNFIVTDCPTNATPTGVIGWPVPVEDQLYLDLSATSLANAERVELIMYNALGAPVRAVQVVPDHRALVTVDVNELTAGTYLIRLLSANNMESMRFVKVGR